MSNLPTPVGNMRWYVGLADESYQQDGITLKKVYSNTTQVWAAIEPTKTGIWLMGVQTEIGAITHKITIRFRNDIHQFKAVLRQREMLDGSINIEVFRIHRAMEWEGKQTFLVLDAELLTGTI